MEAVDSCPAPLVVRVQGYALGGGSGLVACADVVVAAPDATFGFTEVRLGIIPAVISPFVFAKIGAGAARRFFLTGERFDAETALRIGLVDEVAEDLDAAVERVVGEILKSGPEATRAAKRLAARAAERRRGARADRGRAARRRRGPGGAAGVPGAPRAELAALSAPPARPRRRGRPRRHDVLRGADAAPAALRRGARALEGGRRHPRGRVRGRARSSAGSRRGSSRRASASSGRCSSGSAG